jgi:hypothetical protein
MNVKCLDITTPTPGSRFAMAALGRVHVRSVLAS